MKKNESVDVDKLLEKSGSRGPYQYTILILAFAIWISHDLISISLPYLEKTSILKYTNQTYLNETTFFLNYEICERKKNNLSNLILDNITFSERSGHSWVIEYEIECDRIKTGLLGSVVFLGVLFGSFAFQFIPDAIGRKKTITISGIVFSLILILFNFAKSYSHILILCLLAEIFATLGVLTVYMMSNEITAIELRSVFGAIINSAFSASGIIFILLYKYFDSWRFCFSFASLFNLLVILIFYLFTFESPRFYSSHGDYKNMIKVIRKIAVFNGLESNLKVNYPLKFKEISNNSAEEESLHTDDLGEVRDKLDKLPPLHVKQYSYFTLFTLPSLRLTFFINCYLWFSTSGIYYGLSIYIKNLPGDLYVNGIFIYTFEVFAYVLSAWIINHPKFGRRGSIMIFEIISLIVYLLLLLFTFEDKYATLLSFTARFAISGVYNIIYTYSSEVYPTVVRAKGFGFNSLCARLGGIIFPMLIELLDKQVTYVFTMLNILALLLVVFLPETYGKPLEDDIK